MNDLLFALSAALVLFGLLFTAAAIAAEDAPVALAAPRAGARHSSRPRRTSCGRPLMLGPRTSDTSG
jgi:hypothetical protein